VRKNMVTSRKGHHDYHRNLGYTKGKKTDDVAPCRAARYDFRSIAKGLTSKTNELLSKTSLAFEPSGLKWPGVTLG